MKKITYFLFIVVALSFLSCGNKKAKPEPLSDYSSYEYDNVIEVPFKKQDGVRTIQVKINDCAEFPMIFDTGCSGISISVLEFNTLIKHGYISEEDIIDSVPVQIADGSIVIKDVVILKKLKIGDYECHNVQATISKNMEAPLLLGNGALKDVESFSVDDNRNVIKFYLK